MREAVALSRILSWGLVSLSNIRLPAARVYLFRHRFHPGGLDLSDPFLRAVVAGARSRRFGLVRCLRRLRAGAACRSLSWRSRRQSHAAPVPFKTTGMVFTRILKSIHSDHWSMYFKSSSIHFSKGIELRPLICQRQVIPGRTLKRRRCQS